MSMVSRLPPLKMLTLVKLLNNLFNMLISILTLYLMKLLLNLVLLIILAWLMLILILFNTKDSRTSLHGETVSKEKPLELNMLQLHNALSSNTTFINSSMEKL